MDNILVLENLDFKDSSGLKGEEISKKISQHNTRKGGSSLMVLQSDLNLYVSTTIDINTFNILLKYYENNQDYYIERSDYQKLKELEMWFIQVVEPPPFDNSERMEWSKREACKLKGYTWYCNHSVRKKVKISGKIMKEVRDNYSGIKPWRMG
jgi:hypothetical protein